jgi:hypothetical protein
MVSFHLFIKALCSPAASPGTNGTRPDIGDRLPL